MTKHTEHLVGAVFDHPDDARTLVDGMSKNDFPMDQVSILHKAGGGRVMNFSVSPIPTKNSGSRFGVRRVRYGDRWVDCWPVPPACFCCPVSGLCSLPVH